LDVPYTTPDDQPFVIPANPVLMFCVPAQATKTAPSMTRCLNINDCFNYFNQNSFLQEYGLAPKRIDAAGCIFSID
jgi:hypothetical protein